jgi:hypothetical protein
VKELLAAQGKQPPPQINPSSPKSTLKGFANVPQPQRESSKRSINQFLGIKRKAAPQAPKPRSVRYKLTHEQLEAIAHYRSLTSPQIAQHLESILSYLRV